MLYTFGFATRRSTIQRAGCSSRESLEADEETPCSVRHQHTVQSVVEVLVEATALGKFRQDSKGSTALPTSEQIDVPGRVSYGPQGLRG